ncbi:MAG: DNA-binding protein WhiA [Lachnospiraceae bacterium]|nr:DNA-binding protein WhiA [Lachnospiraceae bacterium]
MSFSKDIKDELSRNIPTGRHCQIAEIAAIISLCGKISVNERNQYFIKIVTENLTVARKYFILIKETFQVEIMIQVKRNSYLKKSKSYSLIIKDSAMSLQILKATKLINFQGEIEEDLSIVSNLIVQNTCCKRAFIRGAFLAAGSMSDPEKTYHFEIITTTEAKAVQLRDLIRFFEVDAKVIKRKKYYVVYVKDGAQIVDVLNIMEAHKALMDLENIRILKEMRNSINRQVNCETANISKTVTAAGKQLEDILYIRDTIGFHDLSSGLKEIAELRIEQPDASLKELGSMLSKPIGKSGVNHRLRKLSEIAESIREHKEEK